LKIKEQELHTHPDVPGVPLEVLRLEIKRRCCGVFFYLSEIVSVELTRASIKNVLGDAQGVVFFLFKDLIWLFLSLSGQRQRHSLQAIITLEEIQLRFGILKM